MPENLDPTPLINDYAIPWGINIGFDTAEKVKLEFDANGISIPYPQMELHMNQPSEQAN